MCKACLTLKVRLDDAVMYASNTGHFKDSVVPTAGDNEATQVCSSEQFADVVKVYNAAEVAVRHSVHRDWVETDSDVCGFRNLLKWAKTIRETSEKSASF